MHFLQSCFDLLQQRICPQAIKYLPGTWYIFLRAFFLHVKHPSLWCIVIIKWHNEHLKKKNLHCVCWQTFLLVKSELDKHHSISNLNTVLCIWIKNTLVKIMESALKANEVFLLIFVQAWSIITFSWSTQAGTYRAQQNKSDTAQINYYYRTTKPSNFWPKRQVWLARQTSLCLFFLEKVINNFMWKLKSEVKRPFAKQFSPQLPSLKTLEHPSADQPRDELFIKAMKFSFMVTVGITLQRMANACISIKITFTA